MGLLPGHCACEESKLKTFLETRAAGSAEPDMKVFTDSMLSHGFLKHTTQEFSTTHIILYCHEQDSPTLCDKRESFESNVAGSNFGETAYENQLEFFVFSAQGKSSLTVQKARPVQSAPSVPSSL